MAISNEGNPIEGIPAHNDMTGTAFIASVQGASESAYQRAVYDAIVAGHLPTAFGSFVPVTISDGGHAVTFWAAPDYLGVGTTEDFFRAPMPAETGQKIAAALGCFLPTHKMILAIHQAPAAVHVPFHAYGEPRDTIARFVEANTAIEAARAGRTGLLADYSKDYVVGNVLRRNPGKIVIFGGWRTGATDPVQPMAAPHALGYYDYSQRVRLISPFVTVDGVQMGLIEAMRSGPAVALLSDDGPTPETSLRYPSS